MNPENKMTKPFSKLISASFALGLVAVSARAETDGVGYQEISVKAPFEMPAIKIPVFPKREFVVTDFGAVEGGKAINT
ncbi:MAG: hypothetical protein NTZ16_08200, partial [Verrucomicrobia bacterium]|nr:hypothetical protein [Verrucomicrobiota bacterium]